MARTWTDEQKARQAALIHRWKPWTRSTGARTPQGKATSSRNVLVGNANRAAALAQARQELREAEQKVFRLSRGKENPWLDRVTTTFDQ
jgi:cob(I)alamin adenosyltransferase